MALLNITEADKKMAVSSALVGAGAVASASVGDWVGRQSWAPAIVRDHIDISIGLAGIPVYALARKQKGTIKDIGTALGAGMVVGGTYRALLKNTTVRDFLGLTLYTEPAGSRTELNPNEPFQLEAKDKTVYGPLSGYTSSAYMSPVHGSLGSYTSSYSGASGGSRLF